MPNAVRQFRAAVAALSRQHCALALVLVTAAWVGYGAHTRYGGLLVPAIFAALVPLVWAALFGLTWVVVVGMTPADDPAKQ